MVAGTDTPEGTGRVRFDRESYRKLYVAESAEHQLMALASRGLRDYLIRFADEDGTLLRDTSRPVADLMVVLRARPTDRRMVEQMMADLQRVGFLQLDGKRLWMPRYVDAQASRSPGAVRQQRFRERHKGAAVTDGVTGDVTESVTPSVTSDVTSNRPSRRDETQQTPKPPVVVDSDRETICPLDIVSRLEKAGVFREFSKRLGLSEAALRAEAESTASHWTIGKGMGLKRRNWPGIFRQRLLDRADQGLIADENEPDDEGPPADVKARIAAMRQGIGG